MLTFTHFSNSDNIGDNVCCPLDYFQFEGETAKVDLLSFHPDIDGYHIIGGGGLLYRGIHNLLAKCNSRSILWGAGVNHYEWTCAVFPTFLNHFLAIGLRDWHNPWVWVPCVSCMSPFFDTKAEAQHECIIYEHKDTPIDITDLPRRSNAGTPADLEEVIEFLLSGKKVVTNTYHGAYWCLLLGVPVVYYRPDSSRFFHLPIDIPRCDEGQWQQIDGATIDGFLQVCRNQNKMFHQLVTLKMKGSYESIQSSCW